MQTQGVSNSTTANSNGSSVSQALGGAETSELFTTLLVAQIRNQNPLEPTDPSQFVSQLTQLSQTEALQKLVAQSSSQAASLANLQMLNLGSQVGAQVMVQASSIMLGSTPVQAAVTSTTSADLTAVLTGPDGKEHRVSLGLHGAGDTSFSIDPSKLGLAAGRYSVSVQDAGGSTYPVEVAGTLSSVRMSASGQVTLNVTDVGEVTSDSVTRFLGSKA